MGVVASGSAIGGGRILKGLFSDKSKKQATTAIQAIEQQQTELSNPDLSEESRTFIYENIKNNVAELVDAVDSDVNETEGLSEDQKREVNNLNTKIQAFQVVINDPAASEETKNRARKVSEETQAKIDDIINKKPPIVPPATGGAMMEAEPIAKPTFDTEESLIAEGQKAEEEYKKTGDQVTYEQKIKELEAREKNLVPAPEDAEIGKPEDKDTPRKVIYVQKFFPDKGNENLTERQIGSIEKAIDAGIKAGKSGNEIYGILNALGFAPPNIAGLQENLREYLNNRVEGKDNRTFQETQTKPQEDAVQVETTGQVPVQPEAKVGEEVEQGKPEPKAEVVAEEGVKAEEVTPAQKVKKLRADEQAEYAAMSDPTDKEKRQEIYDRYDKSISPLLLEVALEDVNKARSVKYWMEPEFGAETNKYPQTGKPNSFIKREQSGTIMGGGKWASDDIVAYDKNGKIVGSISIAKEGEEKGAFKIVVREDAKRQGWGKKILDEAEKQGIDIVGNIKKNSFTQSGRNLVRNWLESKIKAKSNTAKPKAEPKLKSKVATRLLFKKAVDLFYDISDTEGSAKKRTISAKRRTFMEQNPSIKYIDDNWPNISKQLKEKGLLEKSKGCP